MTMYSQRPVVAGVLNRRPSDDTLIFGSTTTELENRHDGPLNERFRNP
jgi:hypothetical protein